MASAIQQLFMLPKFRTTILNADASQIVKEHEPALRELQRMFTFLLVKIFFLKKNFSDEFIIIIKFYRFSASLMILKISRFVLVEWTKSV